MRTTLVVKQVERLELKVRAKDMRIKFPTMKDAAERKRKLVLSE